MMLFVHLPSACVQCPHQIYPPVAAVLQCCRAAELQPTINFPIFAVVCSAGCSTVYLLRRRIFAQYLHSPVNSAHGVE